MSAKHPIIAITGSSGAGTTSVTRTFENIFRREDVQAAIVEGDSFHRYDRKEMKLRLAEAEAKATEVVSQAIAAGDVNAINYFLGLKYVEAFAKLASSPQQRTVIVPADFAGLVGAIEGVKALTDNVRNANTATPPSGGSPFVTRG